MSPAPRVEAAAVRLPGSRAILSHAALGALAVALFAVLHLTNGRIEVGGGEGWDGTDYARMLRQGWNAGTVVTMFRPLVVWLAAPAFALTGSAVQAFEVMNFLYVGALAILLSLLLERYGASVWTRAWAVLCIFLSTAFRLFAFYPVVIDLGASVFMTLALWCIVTERRWAATIACVAAALAREYAPALLLFGVHRDLRRGVRIPTIVATYAPAAVAYLLLRQAVARVWAGREDGITLAMLFDNRSMWSDPMFVGLFAYFLVTIAGGLSIVLAAQPIRCWRFLTREPEWLTFTLPILLAGALVGSDTLRYFVPLLPVVAVLYARCSLEWSTRDWVVLSAAALALTLWTQEPFHRMDSASYFADWFPHYIWTRQYPFPSDPPSLWPAWGWRFLVVTAAVSGLAAYATRHLPTRTAS